MDQAILEKKYAILEWQSRKAVLGFDLVDGFGKAAGTRGENPRPFGSITFAVVGQWMDATTYRRRPVPERMRFDTNSWGIEIFAGKTSVPGSDRWRRLPAGSYAVRISSRFYQPVVLGEDHASDRSKSGAIKIPPEDAADALQSHELQPGHLYPFPPTLPQQSGPTLIRGSVKAADADRATITASAPMVRPPNETWEERYLTDASGQWAMVASSAIFPKRPAPTAAVPDPPAPTADVTVTAKLLGGGSKTETITVTQHTVHSDERTVFDFP